VDNNGNTNIIPIKIDDDSPEAAAARAFKTLARILNQARQEKMKKLEEEELANKAAEPVFKVDVQPVIPPEELKTWVIYPDGKFRSFWDLLMTM
jgi:hypothetical protein